MITPLILCGGSGTRLWPLSRKSYPKQFSRLIHDSSLFQLTAQRLSGTGYKAPVIITNSDFRFIVTEQLSEAGVDPAAILIEPSARNTAPAILAAALHQMQRDPDGLMLVAPSDHLVPDSEAFLTAANAGIDAARSGKIVTFGIRATRPETGYGWLELAEDPTDFSPRPLKLAGFVEKPDRVRAAEMLSDGRFVWNAGIFLFAARTMIDAFKAHAPEILKQVQAAMRDARPDLGFLRLAHEPWERAEDISIDYAIMERADNLCVVPYTAGWSDLGDWDAVWRETGPDANGLTQSGNVTGIDCENTLLRSESEGLELVGIGLRDIIAVAMPDAVLIADRNRAQDVRIAVAQLKTKGAAQAETFPRDHRPWGWFETLILEQGFHVKRIVVHPGAALSLQSHKFRAEHWIVVAGTAKVTIDGAVSLVSENESVFIPLGAIHRLANPGTEMMVLIEVQTGSYLGEDDITRYEDIYARGQGAKG